MKDIQKEIKDALELITPGRWELTELAERELQITVGYKLLPDGRHQADWIAEIDAGDDDKESELMYNDAYLIANAPTWLLHQQNLIEQLQTEYAEERSAHNSHVTELIETQKVIKQKDAEIKRLQGLMISKANEIKTDEVDVRELNAWLANSPNVVVIDIKYFMLQFTEHYAGGSYALIIYKEE